MTEARKIRTTSDGCIHDTDIPFLDKKARVKCRVQTYEGPVTRVMAYVKVHGRQMLADTVTGTLYDPKTGRSNSPRLTLIRIEK